MDTEGRTHKSDSGRKLSPCVPAERPLQSNGKSGEQEDHDLLEKGESFVQAPVWLPYRPRHRRPPLRAWTTNGYLALTLVAQYESWLSISPARSTEFHIWECFTKSGPTASTVLSTDGWPATWQTETYRLLLVVPPLSPFPLPRGFPRAVSLAQLSSCFM